MFFSVTRSHFMSQPQHQRIFVSNPPSAFSSLITVDDSDAIIKEDDEIYINSLWYSLSHHSNLGICFPAS